MSLPRFFVDVNNKNDNLIYITQDENVHLNSVLRLRVGDDIDVCLNDGIVHNCTLIEVGKKQSIAQINTSIIKDNHSNITLFMALIKAERMDWAVQKVTELNVASIVPFESEYCTVKDKGNKIERLNRIAVSASKQCGRAVLPCIQETLPFALLLDKLKEFNQIIVAYENETQNAKEILSKLDKTKSIALVIGSEGGFSEAEIEKLKALGAKVVSLGQTILRAETACVALVSAVNYQLDFWEKNK